MSPRALDIPGLALPSRKFSASVTVGFGDKGFQSVCRKCLELGERLDPEGEANQKNEGVLRQESNRVEPSSTLPDFHLEWKDL
jgi:hypothetical protein